MKIMAMLLVAAFALTASTSFAFGDCAGHSRAQLVKNQSQEQTQEQVSQEQPTGTPFAVAEKVAEPVKPAEKAPEKAPETTRK